MTEIGEGLTKVQRKRVSVLLLGYSRKMTEAQESLLNGDHRACARQLLYAAKLLDRAARYLRRVKS